jgi:hypothetical protein
MKKLIEAKGTSKLNEATVLKLQNQLKLVEVKTILNKM